ncbi:MAG TPA: formate dehydrogenase accessory sulfurtransferase FdhD [Thermoanaerobaculia bacterium]
MEPPAGRTTNARVVRVCEGERVEADDVVAVEEPLEIRVNERPVSVTMRTPGDDFELAAGFLFTEGILRDAGDVDAIRHWGSPNVVRVALREGVTLDLQRLQRHFYATSSCGVCGKTSIEALRVMTARVTSSVAIAAAAVAAMPAALRAQQRAFDATGGIHAAGIFDAGGALLRVREDVGRHNAVDKAIGSFFLERAPLGDRALFVSSRTSFEIVQKAIVASIPIVAAVGAPSSLAIELANDFGVTLIGFVREGRFNVYANGGRVTA